jgi:predicted nucleic acid-binding protein
MVCLDTDFLVALLRGDPEATEKAAELEQRNIPTSITPIAAYELFLGSHRSQQKEANITRTIELIINLHLLEFDIWAAEKAASLSTTLDTQGQTIGIRDSMIAGITLRHSETLLTRNIRHFSRIPELKTETW